MIVLGTLQFVQECVDIWVWAGYKGGCPGP
jgi:hypothetical protein